MFCNVVFEGMAISDIAAGENGQVKAVFGNDKPLPVTITVGIVIAKALHKFSPHSSISVVMHHKTPAERIVWSNRYSEPYGV